MIRIINPSRMTAAPFFQDLVNYLDQHEEVTLREIKREFSDTKNRDRLLENYIQAGYILRANRRYTQQVPLWEQTQNLSLDQEIFIRDNQASYQELLDLRFETELTNDTNAAVLREETDFLRERLTLSNYFYKLRKGYPLSAEQKQLYAILGDVHPQYALKYMTTFLLKYIRKSELIQKRRDIFVGSLVALGYISLNEQGKYELQVEFDKERLIFTARDIKSNEHKGGQSDRMSTM